MDENIAQQLDGGDREENMDTSEKTNINTEENISHRGDVVAVAEAVAIADDEDVDVGADLDADESDEDVDEQYVDSDNEEDEDAGGEYGKQEKAKTTGSQNQNIPDAVFGDFSFAGPSGEDRNVDNSEYIKTLSAEAEKWVSEDKCNTAVVKTEKHFVCIKYPAVIRNKEKALASVGGIDEIVEAKKKGKLDLHFRPDDPYCKPTVGLYKKNSHLLIRCRRRKKKDGPSTSSENDGTEDGYEYKVEVIGVIDGVFSFQRPCDYQYLPVVRKPGGAGYRELLSDMLIKFEDDRQSFMNRDVPLYLPPYLFSRSEKPAKYVFQNDEVKADEYIGRARKVRPKGTQRIVYATKAVPKKPNKDAMARYTRDNTMVRDEIALDPAEQDEEVAREANKDAVAKGEGMNESKNKISLAPLKKLFEERPLWSKVGINSRLRALGHGNLKLKDMLNMVAYYFGDGPWIHLWCKFGYDPRQDPKAKIYQTIDFRIRKSWNREQVKAKRGSDHYRVQHSIGNNTIQGHRLPAMGDLMTAGRDSSGPSTSKDVGDKATQGIDSHYQFVPNRLPPYRQMYYQVCDVFEDRVQALAHQNDGQEVVCNEQDGWCVPDFTTMSRDIIAEYTETLLTLNREHTAENEDIFS